MSPFLTGAVQNTQTGGFDATGTVNFDERLLTGRFKDLVKGAAQ